MEKEKYKKGGLLLSENTLLLFDRMTDEEGFVFLKLIRDYHRDGTLPTSDTERLVSISFDVFRADYDASQMKYREKVKRMLKNREKQEICEKSQEICETSQEICETSQEIASNTIHNNTIHNNTSYKESKPKKDVSLSLSDRKEEFRKELEQYRDKYEADMLNDFYEYWTQPNTGHTKMKFESKKFWSLRARLNAWKNRKFDK